ncbi:MAG: hypothetical protein M1833_002845 [Piccolia ochrophora]|nr:MAG: hypothetical protein M1833_002845 [Piccolia ochrophora]
MSSHSSIPPEMHSMRPLPLSTLSTLLKGFASSQATVQVLTTIPAPSAPSSTPPSAPPNGPLQTLFVLDSSFNPPTLAHLQIATSALVSSPPTAAPPRLLLLLAIQNADKAPKPAPFPHRLALMQSLASAIHTQLPSPSTCPAIDIGVTKHPYYHSKASALATDPFYNPETPAISTQMTQIHLLGYDTLLRFFDAKYYSPPTEGGKPFDVLADYFVRNRLRIMGRGKGGREEVDEFVRRLKDGEMDEEGAKREWAERMEVVEGIEGDVSSTRVREAIKAGDWDTVDELAVAGVKQFVQEEKLYLDEG